MEKFSYINATSLEQVTSLLSESGWGEVMLIAGGTDLLAELKEYVETPKTLINLKTLPGMDSITADASGLKIGALATLTISHGIRRFNITILCWRRQLSPSLHHRYGTSAHSVETSANGHDAGTTATKPSTVSKRVETPATQSMA